MRVLAIGTLKIVAHLLFLKEPKQQVGRSHIDIFHDAHGVHQVRSQRVACGTYRQRIAPKGVTDGLRFVNRCHQRIGERQALTRLIEEIPTLVLQRIEPIRTASQVANAEGTQGVRTRHTGERNRRKSRVFVVLVQPDIQPRNGVQVLRIDHPPIHLERVNLIACGKRKSVARKRIFLRIIAYRIAEVERVSR